MNFVKGKRKLTKSEKHSRREKIISFIVLAIASVFFLFPLIYMLGNSFKSDLDLQLHPGSLFPSPGEWTLEHYAGFLWRDGKLDKMPIWMLNSLWSSLATVGITLLLDLITAYAVVFLKFKGKKVFMNVLLAWMAIPGVITIAPMLTLYNMLSSVLGIEGFAGTYAYMYLWLILPGCTGVYNMLLMRSFFLSIPNDIIDSAKSDGAGHFTIFRKIVCPLARSTMMLIVLFTFTSAWNNLVWPQLLMAGKDPHFQTITVALTGYTGGTGYGAKGMEMATGVFALIPIFIIFLITQNKMIDGLASTGVKG